MTETLAITPSRQRATSGVGLVGHGRPRGRLSVSKMPRSVLGRYMDRDGCAREVVAQAGVGGSMLVIDRECATLLDPRLVAHLGSDEPAENAALICAHYLRDTPVDRQRPRPLTAEDLAVGAPLELCPSSDRVPVPPAASRVVDRLGGSYELRLAERGASIPDLRWWRRENSAAGAGQPVSVREAVGALESYEPVRTLTLDALSRPCADISVAVLRAELGRVQASPIVLNRALREAVLVAVDRDELSMSEIAIRCGRTKHDRRGNKAGETSWLSRRIGLMPEGGQGTPTPWIHSDVLALIARRGLGIPPREVEL